MTSEFDLIYRSAEPQPLLTASIALTALVYCRGWLAIGKTRPERFPGWRLGCFLLGMFVLWFAIASPMDAFADTMLSAHMVEHLLLMSVVPPLVLLGSPTVPMLRGVPRWLVRGLIGPLLRVTPLRRLGHWLTRPRVAWLAMNLAFLGWHIPAAFDYALEHEAWHAVEHICFMGTSLLFWWPLIRPWPSHAGEHRWSLVPYLLLADVVNTGLSAFLAFCGRPVYGFYLGTPNAFGLSPLADQVLGAAVMWVAGSVLFLVPAVYITMSLLGPQRSRAPVGVSAATVREARL